MVWGWESFKGNDKFDNAGEVGVWEGLKGNQNCKRNKGGAVGGGGDPSKGNLGFRVDCFGLTQIIPSLEFRQ